jgi:hypothetical protein
VAVAPATPYDTAESILNTARAISADAATANGLSGDILADSQPYVFPMLSKVYRDLQDELISKSSEIMNKYSEVYGLPPTQWGNPRINVMLTYLGFICGPDPGGIYPNITLPQDMIKPLELWECIEGQRRWVPMKQAADSISSRPTQARFGVWDFQQDILYLPGSSQTNDLKIKYVWSMPDLTEPDDPVYILHAQTALACQLVADVAKMLGGLEMAATFTKDASDGRARIVNRTARKESYVSYNRIPFRARGSGRGRR